MILATRRGLIVGACGAFTADEWLPAIGVNFPGREEVPGRHGFIGGKAPAELQDLYVEKAGSRQAPEAWCQSHPVQAVTVCN